MEKHWSLAATAILLVAGCSKQDQPVKKDVKALMAQHVQPTTQTYWDAVQFVSDASGAREIVPKNDAEWQRTAEAAKMLKQLAEELKDPGYAEGRGSDWQAFAQGLADVSEQAQQAAEQKSPEKVLEAGGTLYNVCSACHEVYMPSPGGLVPTDQNAATPTQ